MTLKVLNKCMKVKIKVPHVTESAVLKLPRDNKGRVVCVQLWCRPCGPLCFNQGRDRGTTKLILSVCEKGNLANWKLQDVWTSTVLTQTTRVVKTGIKTNWYKIQPMIFRPYGHNYWPGLTTTIMFPRLKPLCTGILKITLRILISFK